MIRSTANDFSTTSTSELTGNASRCRTLHRFHRHDAEAITNIRARMGRERVDGEALVFRIEESRTGVRQKVHVTRQLAAILEGRCSKSDVLPAGKVFPIEDPRPREELSAGACLCRAAGFPMTPVP